MDEKDVRDLTRLFEAVRCGGHDPTGDDERHAVELLRRIEDAYEDRSTVVTWRRIGVLFAVVLAAALVLLAVLASE